MAWLDSDHIRFWMDKTLVDKQEGGPRISFDKRSSRYLSREENHPVESERKAKQATDRPNRHTKDNACACRL